MSRYSWESQPGTYTGGAGEREREVVIRARHASGYLGYEYIMYMYIMYMMYMMYMMYSYPPYSSAAPDFALPTPPRRRRDVPLIPICGWVSLALGGLRLRRGELRKLSNREGKAFARMSHGATAVLLCRIS